MIGIKSGGALAFAVLHQCESCLQKGSTNAAPVPFSGLVRHDQDTKHAIGMLVYMAELTLNDLGAVFAELRSEAMGERERINALWPMTLATSLHCRRWLIIRHRIAPSFSVRTGSERIHRGEKAVADRFWSEPSVSVAPMRELCAEKHARALPIHLRPSVLVLGNRSALGPHFLLACCTLVFYSRTIKWKFDGADDGAARKE